MGIIVQIYNFYCIFGIICRINYRLTKSIDVFIIITKTAKASLIFPDNDAYPEARAVIRKEGKIYPSRGKESFTNMIIDKIRKMLAEQFGIPEYELSDDCDILGDYCSTPSEKVDVAMLLEDAFSITVSDEEFAELSTLEEIADYVERNL